MFFDCFVRTEGLFCFSKCTVFYLKIQRRPVPLFIIAEGRDEIVGHLVQAGPLPDVFRIYDLFKPKKNG